MAENVSYFEDIDLGDGYSTITVQARKGSRMVTLSVDSRLNGYTLHIDAAEAHELRDALTAVMHKLDPQMTMTKKSEPGIGG